MGNKRRSVRDQARLGKILGRDHLRASSIGVVQRGQKPLNEKKKSITNRRTGLSDVGEVVSSRRRRGGEK